jgi:hypothetical protein
MNAVSLVVSVLALAVSATTAWLTLFRRGTVRMTQPTLIYFGSDKPRLGQQPPPKIFLRTLLFATSKRGRVIESMHVSLARSETNQNFNIWVHGSGSGGSGALVRGSGVFVGETGVAADHHFLTPEDGKHFRFSAGHYRLTVYVQLVGDKALLKLFSQQLEITSDLAAQLEKPGAGLYFDWGPDSSRYLPHIDQRPPALPDELLEAIAKRSSNIPQ